MNIYKISYNSDKILSVALSSSDYHFEGSIYYYAPANRLVFALVKAKGLEQAREMGEQLIVDFKSSNKGSN